MSPPPRRNRMGQTVQDIVDQFNESAGYAAYDGYHSDMDEFFTDEEEEFETVRINGQDIRPRIVPMVEYIGQNLEAIEEEEDSICKSKRSIANEESFMNGALKTIFIKNPGIPPHEMLVNVEARAIRALEMASDRDFMDEEIKSTERRLRQLKHYRAITSDGSLVRAVERVHEKIATQIEEGTVPGDVEDQANMMQCLEKSRRQLSDIKARLIGNGHDATVGSDGGDKADEEPKTWTQLLEEGE